MIVQWLIQFGVIPGENTLEEKKEYGETEEGGQEICGGLGEPDTRLPK